MEKYRAQFERGVIARNQNYDNPAVLIERNRAGDYSTVRIEGEWIGWAAAMDIVASWSLVEEELAKESERFDYVMLHGAPMKKEFLYRYQCVAPIAWHQTARQAIDAAIDAQENQSLSLTNP